MPLSEHVYCVAVAFKMTKWVEQQICIKFCVKLEHSSKESNQMIQKATALGNWWLTAWSLQHTHSGIMSHAEVFGKTSNHPGDSPPTTAHLVPWDYWFFTKLKSPLKGKRFQILGEIQENTMGQLMATGRTVWVSRCLLWRGLRHYCPMYNVSCVLYLLSSSMNVSIFHIIWTGLVIFSLWVWKEHQVASYPVFILNSISSEPFHGC